MSKGALSAAFMGREAPVHPDNPWIGPADEPAKPTPDPVNYPAHYTSHSSGVECIAITRHMTFNLGNVVKYLWRADHKGATLQDLEKARFYLDDEIRRLKAGNS